MQNKAYKVIALAFLLVVLLIAAVANMLYDRALQVKQNDFQKGLAESKEINQGLNAQLAQMQKDLSEANDANQELQKSLADAKDANQGLSAQLTQAQNDLAEIKRANGGLNKRLVQAQRSFAGQRKVNFDLRSLIIEANKYLIKTKTENQSLQAQLAQVQQELAVIKEKKAAASNNASGSPLISWWKFNGDLKDSSGNGDDGINNNGAAFVSDRNGNSSSAISLNGSNQYIGVPNDLPAGPKTISAWVYGNSWDSVWPFAHGKAIVSYGPKINCNPSSQQFYISTTGHVAFYTGCGSELNGTTTIPLYQWHHVAAVIDAAGATTLYLDGAPEATGDTTSGIPVGEPANVTIGMSWAGGMQAGFFSGYMSDVRIYNRALSAPEILAIYDQN